MTALAIFFAIFVFIHTCGGTIFFARRDDTDPPKGHSGLRIFIDHRTGCHYIGNPLGGITPRLDAKGKHVCEPRPAGGGK